jgi:putative ABC transport system permease protein
MFLDLKLAVRSLLRAPAFTATSVLTLALAAGANAAILAVVYAILIKPLPYREPDRLVAVWPQRFQSNIDLLYLREHSPMFSSIGGVAPGWSMSLTGPGEPIKVNIARVSGNLFETLGASPLLGRPLNDAHATPGRDGVVVLGHDLWKKQFGGNPAIVGRSIQMDGSPFEVLGVLPRGFEIFGLKADAYTPFAMDAAAWYHQLSFSLVVARLAPARSIEDADREYRALIPAIRKARGYPDEYGRTAHLEDLRTAVVGDVRSSLVALSAAVALILLVAGVNVGILQLTRASARRRDLAVRSALGAAPLRLARQLLAEGIVLAGAGAAAGVALAAGLLPVLISLLPANTPRVQEIALSGPVGAAIFAAAAIVAAIVGTAPLVTMRQLRVSPLLRSVSSTASAKGARTRGALVALEIGAAIVLTIAAALMVRSVWNLHRIDPGFHGGESVLSMHIQPPANRFRDASVAQYYDQVLQRVRAVAGVRAAGAIQHLPLSGFSWNASLDIDGHYVPPGGSQPLAGLRIVTPGYFTALGQPVIAGRPIERADVGALTTVVVNATLATKYFGAPASAIGRTLRIRGGRIQSEWMRIVGVVADVHHTSLTAAPLPEIYTPVGKTTIPAMMLAVRSDGDPRALVPAVREAIWSVYRDVPVSDIQTMESRVGESLGRPRLLTTLLSMFAGLGVLLATVGVYGVVSYSVSQRRRELGIMMALGAARGRVMRSVLREGLGYAAAGLAIGVPAAAAASRMLRTLVYEVRPTDAATYASIAAAVLAIVFLACALPAHRASRVDPVAALKDA